MNFQSSDNDVSRIEDSAYLRENQFERLLQRRIALKVQMDGLKRQVEGLNVEMSAMMATAGIKSVRYLYGVDWNGDPVEFTVGYVEGGVTRTLKKDRLKELGVSDWIIEGSMVDGRVRKPSVSVRKVGGKSGEEYEDVSYPQGT